MKLVQIEEQEFDRYVKTEPDCSVYHTARWNGFFKNPKSTYQYLAYADDLDFYHAYALVEIRKRNIFSKLEAVLEYGYLINFYDANLFDSFHRDLCDYLKTQKVKVMTISPNILYETPFGNNDFLVKKLEGLGYRKVNDVYTYTRSFDEVEEADKPVKYTVFDAEKEDLELIEKQYGYEISDAVDYFGKDIRVKAITIDFEGTYATIEEQLNEDPENESLLNLKNDVDQAMEKYGKPILEYVCFICYDKHAYILYTDYLKNNIKAIDALWNALSSELRSGEYKGYSCSKSFIGSKENKRIGEFTLYL